MTRKEGTENYGKNSKMPSITGTREWAKHNVNCCTGCQHGCKYCYAAHMAARFKRVPRHQWDREVVREDEVKKDRRRLNGTIMFPTTHDVTPGNVEACEAVLSKLLAAGNEVLVVSKPHLTCVERLLQSMVPYRQQVMFRFTIGVMDEELRAFWEPGAPPFSERLACLRRAFDAGYRTSVSCEPLLEPWSVEGLVAAVRPFVTDSIWLGKLNHARTRTRWAISANDPHLLRLEEWQSDERVKAIYELFKNDPPVKYKDSYKKVLGLELATTAGSDQ